MIMVTPKWLGPHNRDRDPTASFGVLGNNPRLTALAAKPLRLP